MLLTHFCLVNALLFFYPLKSPTMTQAISAGFCHHCHHTEPLASLDELKATQESLWQRPVLQLLDIQMFSPEIGQGQEPPRFYLALSDSRHCVWGIVPPASPLEAAIHSADLECGCLITIIDYVVVAAKCGKCVMVILDASYSSTPFSLIGEPTANRKWMPLSHKSLIQQHAQAAAAAAGRASARAHHKNFTERLLHEFLPENGVVMLDPMERWAITGRVLWKSKLRRTDKSFGHGAATRGDNADDDGAFRYVFDCVLVDARGDAMKLVFWGCRRYFDVVTQGMCVRACDGLVKRGDHNEPICLHFQERSIVEPLEGGDAGNGDHDDVSRPSTIPTRPSRLIGACAEPFLSVGDVVRSRSVGDVVTVQGLVVAIQPCVQIRTVRGNMDKMSLTLRDAATTRAGAASAVPAMVTIEVTLWDEAARTCTAAPGQWWCLRDVTVRYFGSVKQLSSRASSEMFQLPPAFLESWDPATVFALPTDNVSVAGGGAKMRTQPDSIKQNDRGPWLQGAPFFFDFNPSNAETSFVLCRIGHIKLPLFYVACQSCGVQMKGVACLSCSSTATELRFLLRMDVTDGVDVFTSVVGFTSVAEALFGETTASFLSKISANPAFGSLAIAEVMALPVLVKLAKSGTGVRHILELKHVDLAKTASAVADAIAAYL